MSAPSPEAGGISPKTDASAAKRWSASHGSPTAIGPLMARLNDRAQDEQGPDGRVGGGVAGAAP